MPKSHMRLTLNAGRQDALMLAADAFGVSYEKLVRDIVDSWLQANGYMPARPTPAAEGG